MKIYIELSNVQVFKQNVRCERLKEALHIFFSNFGLQGISFNSILITMPFLRPPYIPCKFPSFSFFADYLIRRAHADTFITPIVKFYRFPATIRLGYLRNLLINVYLNECLNTKWSNYIEHQLSNCLCLLSYFIIIIIILLYQNKHFKEKFNIKRQKGGKFGQKIDKINKIAYHVTTHEIRANVFVTACLFCCLCSEKISSSVCGLIFL